jgi:hypothetical protein
VSDLPALRASDEEREQAIAQLREQHVAGRLTLEEFAERVGTAQQARTGSELAELTHDLPVAQAPSRRRTTRFVLSIFGSTERMGRIRVGRRVVCLVLFGNIDLDLRHATLDSDIVTVVGLTLFGAFDVYVPEGVEADVHGLAVFGHRGEHGNEPPPQPGAPLVRVFSYSLFAGVDVWRVPVAWAGRGFGEIIKAIRKGEHQELEA